MIKWIRSKVGRSESSDKSMSSTDNNGSTAPKRWIKNGEKWVRTNESPLAIETDSANIKDSPTLPPNSRPASVANCSSDDETTRCSSFTSDSALDISLRTQPMLHQHQKSDKSRSLSPRWIFSGGDWVKQSAAEEAVAAWDPPQQVNTTRRREPMKRRKAPTRQIDELPAMMRGASISFGCVMALPPSAATASGEWSSCNGKLSSEEPSADTSCVQVCPICCEARSDVQVLEHWEELGDVSEHKMCGHCRLQYPAHECPFCKELLHKNEFICIMHDFVADLAASAGTDDPHMMVALFEQWQVLEMQFEGNLRVIGRLAKLVIEDESFISILSAAVDRNESWLRDMAGILFRFWALLHDTGLDCPLYASLIDAAVESILQPLEMSPGPVKLQGDYYGALYVQTLTAWLCATKSGFPTQHLRGLVQRVGAAVVHCYETYATPALRQKIAGSLLSHYLRPSHEPVWGSQEADIVWCTFCKTTDDSGATSAVTSSSSSSDPPAADVVAEPATASAAAAAAEQSEEVNGQVFD